MHSPSQSRGCSYSPSLLTSWLLQFNALEGRRQMHSTSRYVKHWRYRPLALACLLATWCGVSLAYLGYGVRLPRCACSCIAVDRRKWRASRGGGSPLVRASLRLAACGLAGCGWLRCNWPARSARWANAVGLALIVGAEDCAETAARSG